jgi:Clathrin adaptor complex small chain
MLLVSRQGKVRLAKWFTTLSPKEKSKIVKDVTQLVLARRAKMCNFLEYKCSSASLVNVNLSPDSKIVYRRFSFSGCLDLQKICLALFYYRNRFRRQRTDYPRDFTPLRRGFRSVLWKCNHLYIISELM